MKLKLWRNVTSSIFTDSVNMLIPGVNFIFLQVYKNFNTGKKSKDIYWMSCTYPNKWSMRNKRGFSIPGASIFSHFSFSFNTWASPSLFHLQKYPGVQFHHSNYTHATTNYINRFFLAPQIPTDALSKQLPSQMYSQLSFLWP